VAAGLLSGGGAGYLVSIYTARKESEDRNRALQLDRDKFEHEKQKYRDEQERARLLRTSTFDARRQDALRQVRESIAEVDDNWRRIWFSARDGGVSSDDVSNMLELFHGQFSLIRELFYVDCAPVAGDLMKFSEAITKTLNKIVGGEATGDLMDVYAEGLSGVLDSVREAELDKPPEKPYATPESP